MNGTNGHSLSGAHQRLFELATKAGIRPTWSSLAVKAGLSPNTVRQAFGEPGASVNSRTINALSAALRISPLEVRQIHAALQLEAPTPSPPPEAPKTGPAPPPEPEPDPTPRNFWDELTQHALDGVVVIVAAKNPANGVCLARGVIAGLHGGWVAVQANGDKRPIRLRIEDVTDVRKAPAA